MFGTFLVVVAALVIAVVGCAWLNPVAPRGDPRPDVRPRRKRRQAALAADDG